MSAVISDDGLYRYLLRREWLGGDGTVCFIMLNPSTADAQQDDATIRRCIGFAKHWRYAALEVVNLFAFRARNPKDMFAAVDPVGAENDRYILEAAHRATLRVAAWGAHAAGRFGTIGPPRVAHVRELLADYTLHAIGLTASGNPAHPLYQPLAAELIRWPA